MLTWVCLLHSHHHASHPLCPMGYMHLAALGSTAEGPAPLRLPLAVPLAGYPTLSPLPASMHACLLLVLILLQPVADSLLPAGCCLFATSHHIHSLVITPLKDRMTSSMCYIVFITHSGGHCPKSASASSSTAHNLSPRLCLHAHEHDGCHTHSLHSLQSRAGV